MKKNIWIVWGLFFYCAWAAASPSSLTYQGRIVKSDGTPLQHSSVSFQFEITNPSGNCVLYREQVNGINMTGSNGIFDVKIGASHSYPADPSFKLIDSFNNSLSLTCDGGVVYNPTVADERLLRVQFYDGLSWRAIAPASTIRSVPFAAYSEASNKLGSHSADEFVLKTVINGNSSCDGGSFLTWNAATQTFGCELGSVGSGTVTNVTSANSYLSISNSTTVPLLTLNVGTGANTVAAGNDSRLSNARIPTGTAGGDLSGTYPNPSVAKIQGVGLDFSTAPTTGQVLSFDGTNWIPASLPAASSGTVTSITAGTGLTGGAITASGTIGLGTALSGLNSIATNGYIQRTGAGTYSTTLGSPTAPSSNNTLVLRDGSGVSSFYGLGLAGATSGSLVLKTADITNAYSLTFPNDQGGANQVLANNGSGVLSWATMPTAPGADCSAGSVLTYTSGTFSCVPDQTGAAGGGITSLAGQTGSSQAFALNTNGNAPAWNSATDVHTLSLPFARTASVTAGLISKAEYETFNNKQSALGFTPLNPNNNLSELSATAATARTNLGLGSAALKEVPTSGNASTTEVVLGDDTRLTNARAPSGAAGGDLGGTYPNPDVNKIKGVSLAMTSLTTGDFLKYNGTNWINSIINISDVSGLSASLGTKIDQSQISGTCSTSKTLTFSSVTGTWTCSDIAIAGTQVTYASQAAKTFLAAPTGAAGAPIFRTLESTDLPSTVTEAFWSTSPVTTAIHRNTGVGIYESNPSEALQITDHSLLLKAVANAENVMLKLDGALGQYMPSIRSYNPDNVTNKYAWWSARDNNLFLIQGGTTDGAGAATYFNVTEMGSVGVLTQYPNGHMSFGGSHSSSRPGYYATGGPGGTTRNDVINIWESGESRIGLGVHSQTMELYSSANMHIQMGTRSTDGNGTFTPMMTMKGNTGNVGIGTTNPSSLLHVAGDAQIDGNVLLYDNTAIKGNDTTSLFALYAGTGASDGANIALHGGDHATQPGNFYATYGGGLSGFFQLRYHNGAVATNVMRATSAGDIGIGTTGPTARLHVYDSANGVVVAKFQSGTGVCSVTPNSGMACSSDLRLKEDIKPIPYALEKIQQVHGVTYRWKDRAPADDSRHLGFIAQDVQKVAPELVREDGNGFKQVNYANFVAVLSEAVKEFYYSWQKDSSDLHRKHKDLELKTVDLERQLSLERQKNHEMARRLELIEKALQGKNESN